MLPHSSNTCSSSRKEGKRGPVEEIGTGGVSILDNQTDTSESDQWISIPSSLVDCHGDRQTVGRVYTFIPRCYR